MFEDLPVGFAFVGAVIVAVAAACLTAYTSISRRTRSKVIRIAVGGPFAIIGIVLLGLCGLAIIGNMFAWVPLLLWKLFGSNG